MRIRLDTIEAKEMYFSQDLNNDELLREFDVKYEKFRSNYIEFSQPKNKVHQ